MQKQKFWNNLLVKLGLKKPKIEEWDEDHAISMIMNTIISEFSEEELREISKEDQEEDYLL